MYIVELAGRHNKTKGIGCLVHNNETHMPYLFVTVKDAINYVKSRCMVPIYLDRIEIINENNDEIYVYKFSDNGDDVSKEINIIPCDLHTKEL